MKFKIGLIWRIVIAIALAVILGTYRIPEGSLHDLHLRNV